MNLRPILTLLTLMAVMGAGLTSVRSDASLLAAEPPPPVVREALVTGLPEITPGHALQLVRYVIQPGTTLPAHTHPGMQIAWIESGVLHYVVVEGGSIPIYRSWANGASSQPEHLHPGESTDLLPGDAVVETESVVHYGANQGASVVVIWAATLLEADQPPAIVHDVPAASPTP